MQTRHLAAFVSTTKTPLSRHHMETSEKMNPPLLVAQVSLLGYQRDIHSQPSRYHPSAGAAGLPGYFTKAVAENSTLPFRQQLLVQQKTTTRAKLFIVKSLLFL